MDHDQKIHPLTTTKDGELLLSMLRTAREKKKTKNQCTRFGVEFSRKDETCFLFVDNHYGVHSLIPDSLVFIHECSTSTLESLCTEDQRNVMRQLIYGCVTLHLTDHKVQWWVDGMNPKADHEIAQQIAKSSFHHLAVLFSEWTWKEASRSIFS